MSADEALFCFRDYHGGFVTAPSGGRSALTSGAMSTLKEPETTPGGHEPVRSGKTRNISPPRSIGQAGDLGTERA
jgi:hypothetical protein